MILFIADIHLKLGQKNVPKEWAINRYNMFFEQVCNIDCSRIILGGDIFDRVPSVEELELYFKFIKSLHRPTIIYSGNHEMLTSSKSFFTNLKEVTNAVNSLVTVVDSLYEEDKFYIVPYELIKNEKLWKTLSTRKAVFTHVRGAIEPHVKPEINLELLKPFPIVFAGDLHSHDNCQDNIVYPGSPMTTSFHRNEVSTGYILIDHEDLTNWSWHNFNLPQLIRKTITDQSEMVKTDFHHTIYELESDMVGLSKIKDSELLDKKLVKRNSDAALILGKDMSISDELMEYWTYILELPNDVKERALGRFHDYAAKNSGME